MGLFSERPRAFFEAPRSARAGESLRGELVIEAKEAFSVDFVSVRLVSTDASEQEIYVLEKGEVEAGVHRLPFSFALPARMTPTHGGGSPQQHPPCGYRLKARLSIPWRVDAEASRDVAILPPAPGRASASRGHGSSPGKEAPEIELVLDSDVVCSGGYISGRVALRSGGQVRDPRVELVELLGIDADVDEGAEVTASEVLVELDADELASGRPAAFSALISSSFGESFRTSDCRRLHRVVASHLVRPPIDPTVDAEPLRESASCPLRIVAPGTEITTEGGDWKIGAEREEAAAEGAASELGVELRDGQLFKRVGKVKARVFSEFIEGQTFYSAELSYPDLGMAMSVEEQPRAKMVARGRDPAQVRGFLDALGPSLEPFSMIFADDRSLSVSRRQRAGDGGLKQLASEAFALAGVLSREIERIPPPGCAAHLLDAYRQLASDLDGTLSPGGLRVRGSFEGNKARVMPCFHRDRDLAGTRLSLSPDPPVLAEFHGIDGAASLPPAARKALELLLQPGDSIEVTDRGIAFETARVFTRADEALGWLRALSQAARHLQPASLPYR